MATAGRSESEPTDGRDASRPDQRFVELRATGDRRLRNALVEDHRWLAAYCARRFKGKGEPIDDLQQVAVVGLLKAVDRFDPGLGYKFPTYAVPTIVGELRRHFRDRTWPMRVPRRSKENYLAVKSAADELHHVLGRSPSIPELAEWAGLSVEDALEALAVGNSYRGVPFDEPGDHEEVKPDRSRQFGALDAGYKAAEAHVVIPGLLATLPTERERRIIELRFVHEMSQSQIAAELGMSQVHVSRLLRRSLSTMRRQLDH